MTGFRRQLTQSPIIRAFPPPPRLPRRQGEPSTPCRALFSEPPALSRARASAPPPAGFALDSTELSGLLQNFFHLVRIVQRVHRRVGEKLRANHGEREAAQVNSPVGK